MHLPRIRQQSLKKALNISVGIKSSEETLDLLMSNYPLDISLTTRQEMNFTEFLTEGQILLAC
jgi:hypothetical protein